MEVSNTTHTNNKKQLSAIVTADSFFYAILDGQNVLMHGVEAGDPIKIWQQIKVEENVHHTDILLLNDQFTLIHATEYQPGIVQQIGRDLEWLNLGEGMLSADLIEQHKMYLCYQIPKPWVQVFRSAVPGRLSISHCVETMIDALPQHKGVTIQICKVGGSALVACCKNESLLSTNIIHTANPMNILYHTTLLKDTLEITEEDVTVVIASDEADSDGIYALLSKYHKRVQKVNDSRSVLQKVTT